MKKQYIIPIFVPHLGCPNDCIFCNQRSISGKQNMITKEEIEKTIEFYLNNIKDKEAKIEVAFFGGSFTGIDVEKQEEIEKIELKKYSVKEQYKKELIKLEKEIDKIIK